MILVTGGAGFVGLNVAEQLSARGEQVVLYDLSAPPPEFKWKVVVEKGDVTNRTRLEEVFLEHQPKQVVHLAAITARPQRDASAPRRIADSRSSRMTMAAPSPRTRPVRFLEKGRQVAEKFARSGIARTCIASHAL